jgi:hypothetical protein
MVFQRLLTGCGLTLLSPVPLEQGRDLVVVRFAVQFL